MAFLLLIVGIVLFTIGYMAGRSVKEHTGVKQIEDEIGRAMEEENKRLVKKATKNLKK